MNAAERQAELDLILGWIRVHTELGSPSKRDLIWLFAGWMYMQHDIDTVGTAEGNRKAIFASRIRVVATTSNTITVDHGTYQEAWCLVDEPCGPDWQDVEAPRLKAGRKPLQRIRLKDPDARVDGLWALDSWSPVPVVWDPRDADQA